MVGKNVGNNIDLCKVAMGIDKKSSASPKSGSRFAVLNEELVEGNTVKPSQSYSGKQGLSSTKKVLAEISNRKPPSKPQVSGIPNLYRADTNASSSNLNKSSKENVSDVLSRRNGKGFKKTSQFVPNITTQGMDEDIEDTVVLQSLHSEIMELENLTNKECTKPAIASPVVEQVIWLMLIILK